MRRYLMTFVTSGALALAACGGAQDGADATDDMEMEMEEEAAMMMAADCFLANATMEEAAERTSPLAMTDFMVGGNAARICYGAPSARERVVFGELVPFGEAWRLGANEATALHLTGAAMVGGMALDAGSYSLYAMPGETEWMFHVNSNFERWGIPISDEVMAMDVGMFSAAAEMMDEMVEMLTISFAAEGDGGNLMIQWENTSVTVPVMALMADGDEGHEDDADMEGDHADEGDEDEGHADESDGDEGHADEGDEDEGHADESEGDEGH